MAKILLADLYEQKIEPRLDQIKAMLLDGKSKSEIYTFLDISNYEWKFSKMRFPELREIIEEVKGKTSDYYVKIVPFMEEIEKWIYAGFDDISLCKKLGVSNSMYLHYKNVYPEFKKFTEDCKEIADTKVEGAMFKNSIGFEYQEKKETIEEGELLFDKEGKPKWKEDSNGNLILNSEGKKVQMRRPGKIKIERTTKQSVPNVTAGTFWLTNRQKQKWSLKHDQIEIDTKETARAIHDSLTAMQETIPNAPDIRPLDKAMMDLKELDKKDLMRLRDLVGDLLSD